MSETKPSNKNSPFWWGGLVSKFGLFTRLTILPLIQSKKSKEKEIVLSRPLHLFNII
jgi:hypothetical protein